MAKNWDGKRSTAERRFGLVDDLVSSGLRDVSRAASQVAEQYPRSGPD